MQDWVGYGTCVCVLMLLKIVLIANKLTHLQVIKDNQTKLVFLCKKALLVILAGYEDKSCLI